MLNTLSSTGVPILDTRNGVTTPRIQIDVALAALGPPCVVDVTPTSTAVGRAGGSRAISVMTEADCPWRAESRAEFVALIGRGRAGEGSMALGYGPGVINVTVAPNTTSERRFGFVTVLDQHRFDIAQAGAPLDLDDVVLDWSGDGRLDLTCTTRVMVSSLDG